LEGGIELLIGCFFKGECGHPSYHLFFILVHHHKGKVSSSGHRDKLMEGLRNFKVQTSIHYPPLHPRMDREDVKWIAKKMKEILRDA